METNLVEYVVELGEVIKSTLGNKINTSPDFFSQKRKITNLKAANKL